MKFRPSIYFLVFLLVSCGVSREENQENDIIDKTLLSETIEDFTIEDSPVINPVQETESPTGLIEGALEGDPCSLPPASSQIVINELMIDPKIVADTAGEWIELYNPTDSAISLNNWKLERDGGAQVHTITSLTINSGEYAVICRNNDPAQNGGVTCKYKYSTYDLINTGQKVTLKNASNTVIDEVTYPSAPAPAGKSLALKHYYLDNSGVTNFAASTSQFGAGDFGTPGAKNTDVWTDVEVAACDDSNLCTYNFCEVGKCKNPWKTDCCLIDTDCNDGKVCTTDKCGVVTPNLCNYAPIPNCCTQNSDCSDANPCNFDYCWYNECRFTSYNVVANCCWQLDSECDDGNICTQNKCDTVNHKCQFNPLPNCCQDASGCNDNDVCTTDKCVSTACINEPITNCCPYGQPDADQKCADTNPCTLDVCSYDNTCLHFQQVDGSCCGVDKDCKMVNGVYLEDPDNNPCTSHKCVSGMCHTQLSALCFITLPSSKCAYGQSFDTVEELNSSGFKVFDKGGYSKFNWKLSTADDLGLGTDKHLRFSWNPSVDNLDSTLFSPVFDTTCALIASILNQKPFQITIQMDMAYKHETQVSGGDVYFSVVATTTGDYINAEQIWPQKGTPLCPSPTDPCPALKLADDREFDIISMTLPASYMTQAKLLTLQIGLKIQTSNSSNLKYLDIDRFRIVANKAPKVIDQSAPCQELTTIPNIITTLATTSETKILVDDPDHFVNPYIQHPAPYLAQGGPTKTFDVAPFISISGTSYQWIGVCSSDKFFSTVKVNAPSDSSYARIYKMGFIAADGSKEWDTVPGFIPLEKLYRFKVILLIDKGYIIWSPIGETKPWATAVRDLITQAGRTSQILDDITAINTIPLRIDGVFSLLGVGSLAHALNAGETDILLDYMNLGGKMYLEGGEFFENQQGDGLKCSQGAGPNYSCLGTVSKGEGYSKIGATWSVDGTNFLNGYKFTYTSNYEYNGFNDKLTYDPAAPGTIRPVIEVKGTAGIKPYYTGIANEENLADLTEAIYCVTYADCINMHCYKITPEQCTAEGWNTKCKESAQCDDSNVHTIDSCDTVNHKCIHHPVKRTVASSVLIGGLVEGTNGTLTDMMKEILDFLEKGFGQCTGDLDCADFNPCSEDKCNCDTATPPVCTCSNAVIAGCKVCETDADCCDNPASSCAGGDEACDINKKYCVKIPSGMVGGTDPFAGRFISTNVPKIFGNSPTSATSIFTISNYAIIKDLNIKVKINHTYRGEVELVLNHAGQEMTLRTSNMADAADNIYETYDVGVATQDPGGKTLDVLLGDKPVGGEWSLTATDTEPVEDNGILTDFRVYAKYEFKTCTSDAECDDGNPCTTQTCNIAQQKCEFSTVSCNDNNSCTEDSCKILTATTYECVHDQIQTCQGSACQKHADCGYDDVCLDYQGHTQPYDPETLPVCKTGVITCQCFAIKGLPFSGKPANPLNIPDGNPGSPLLATKKITADDLEQVWNYDKGVVDDLNVRVVTKHSAIEDLKIDICHESVCITLHNRTGGAVAGLYYVYDYDLPTQQLSAFDGKNVLGDWTLRIADYVTGSTGTLVDWGVYITPLRCLTDDDCTDTNLCTTDECNLVTHTCKNTEIPCQPSINPCIENKCDPGIGSCATQVKADGAVCDDDKFCTVDDQCIGGVCKSGYPKDCSFLVIGCVESAVCDEDIDNCKVTYKANDSPCDDGDQMTCGDKCLTGKCVSGTVPCVGCSTDFDCLNAEDGNLCNGTEWKCLWYEPLKGKYCTLQDLPVDCGVDPGKCTEKSCIGMQGHCTKTNTPCTLWKTCMSADECCDPNYCVKTNPTDDWGKCGVTNDPCTDSSMCLPSDDNYCHGDCSTSNKQNGFPCDDALYCTVNDICIAGACLPQADRDCSSFEDQCNEGKCDESLDKCYANNKPDNTLCELEGDGCTVDKCVGGTCTFKNMFDCSFKNTDCRNGVCVPVGYGGQFCDQVAKPDNTVCTDDSGTLNCTDDLCKAGECTHPKKVTCPGVACGGDHTFDAGDDECGLVDACVNGTVGPYPSGTCQAVCNDPTKCVSAASGAINKELRETLPCVIEPLTLTSLPSPYGPYVDTLDVSVAVQHPWIADLELTLIAPSGYEQMIWDNLGGQKVNFFNTFDMSFPNVTPPMCRFSGEKIDGSWKIRACDIMPGSFGQLIEWKIYTKGTNNVNINQGDKCTTPLILDSSDGTRNISGTTACAQPNYQGTCNPTNVGADMVYKFNIGIAKRVTVTLPQTSYDMVMYIKENNAGDCKTGNIACADAGTKGGVPESIDIQIKNLSDYYLVIDQGTAEYGAYNYTAKFATLKSNGQECNEDMDCLSLHCAGPAGYPKKWCCDSGNCCPYDSKQQYQMPECPASTSDPPKCNTTSTCQGTRRDSVCSNYMCGTITVNDDTACNTTVKALDCGYYKDIYCTGLLDQTPPICPTYCMINNNCDTGFADPLKNAHCDEKGQPPLKNDSGTIGNMECVQNLGNGAASNEDSDCRSNHSRNFYCCDSSGTDCCPDANTNYGQNATAPCGRTTTGKEDYQYVPKCNDRPTCQGQRKDAYCNNYICGGTVLDDDSGCTKTLGEAKICSPYINVFCNGQQVQSSPPCIATCNQNCVPADAYLPNIPWAPTSTEVDACCIDQAHCDKVGANYVCLADLDNGEPCSNENSDCKSNYCNNWFCCAGVFPQDCCSQASDCPASYQVAPSCDSTTTCQGHRFDKKCDITDDKHICDKLWVDDDTACDKTKKSKDCGLFISIYCNAALTQTEPICWQYCDQSCDPLKPYNPYINTGKTGVESDTCCLASAHCDPDPGNPSNTTCILDKNIDEGCDENSDCISAYCQNLFCCNTGQCCKGCKPASMKLSFGEGGIIGTTASSVQVQTQVGSDCFTGRSDGTNYKFDWGFYTNSTVQTSL
jgi:subtilisin-like proprotein convertase family protein